MNYYLAEACQNTFVLFDLSELNEELLQMAHECLQQEGRDDALLLIDGREEQGAYVTRMVVLGLDGALGEFCGNGARACAAYLFEHYPHNRFFLESPWGVHELKKEGESYSIQLPPARLLPNPKFLTHPPRLAYVEVIEPHLVVCAAMSDEELLQLGRELNQQREIYPCGINVNAYQVLAEGTLFVKTYERGVQRLTKSCGSGSIACAVHAQTEGRVQVVTAGGVLEITIGKEGIELRGPASFFDSNRREEGD